MSAIFPEAAPNFFDILRTTGASFFLVVHKVRGAKVFP